MVVSFPEARSEEDFQFRVFGECVHVLEDAGRRDVRWPQVGRGRFDIHALDCFGIKDNEWTMRIQSFKDYLSVQGKIESNLKSLGMVIVGVVGILLCGDYQVAIGKCFKYTIR